MRNKIDVFSVNSYILKDKLPDRYFVEIKTNNRHKIDTWGASTVTQSQKEV